MVRKQGPCHRQEGGDREAGRDLLILLKGKLGAEAVVLPAGRGGQVTPTGRAIRKWLRTGGTQGTVWGFTLGVQKLGCIGITLGVFEKHKFLPCPPSRISAGALGFRHTCFPKAPPMLSILGTESTSDDGV